MGKFIHKRAGLLCCACTGVGGAAVLPAGGSLLAQRGHQISTQNAASNECQCCGEDERLAVVIAHKISKSIVTEACLGVPKVQTGDEDSSN